MNIEKLILITDTVEKLSTLTFTDVDDILEKLEGLCFDEEETFKIQEYHMNGRIFEDV